VVAGRSTDKFSAKALFNERCNLVVRASPFVTVNARKVLAFQQELASTVEND
jgi:hypothetical protein